MVASVRRSERDRPTIGSPEAVTIPAESTLRARTSNPLERDDSGEMILRLYRELRAIAGVHLRRERMGHTLQPTAMVHEVYLKLATRGGDGWRSRGEFVAAAARAMREILVDHARRKRAMKRGGDWERVCIERAVDPDAPEPSSDGLDVLALHEALADLEQVDDRAARVVMLRFFGGLTVEEAADALGVSRSCAEEDWRVARAWLKGRLSPDHGPGA